MSGWIEIFLIVFFILLVGIGLSFVKLWFFGKYVEKFKEKMKDKDDV